jgi:hypothetical protein
VAETIILYCDHCCLRGRVLVVQILPPAWWHFRKWGALSQMGHFFCDRGKIFGTEKFTRQNFSRRIAVAALEAATPPFASPEYPAPSR